MTDQPTEWDPDTGMVVTHEQADTHDPTADREDAITELVWLMTKAGPFSSPRERAENLLANLTDASVTGHSTFRYLDTLSRAQRQVRDGLADGTICPCCKQRAQEYHRKLNSGMASALIAVWVRFGQEWAHVPDVAARIGGDFAKLRHWGLVRESSGKREDGGRQGDWKITSLGREFVLGLTTVPSHITIFNNEVSGRDGADITIRDALGDRFNYDELMRGV